MRQIAYGAVVEAVRDLCIQANRILPQDIKESLELARQQELPGLARDIMGDLIDNYRLAEEQELPVCQDTGLTVVFVKLGQEIHLTGGLLGDAVNDGVSQGYLEGLLRCSVVADPLRRVNTGDNTPAVLHVELVPGDALHITVAPKGAGSENMSGIRMFNPSASREDIVSYVVDCVRQAGSNPCPPIVLGVGMGGNFEYSALLAKRALCRSIARRHPDPFYAELEGELLRRINETDVGPQGFGGKTTALAVNIETYPTHIASLPVAVNIGCHVTRHASAVL